MERLITKLSCLSLIVLFALQSHAKPVRFQLSEGDAKVEFEGTGKPSLLKIHGSSEQKLDGYFVFDGKKISGKAVFNLETLDTGIDLRNEHMKNRYLEVAKFPKAELDIKEIVLSKEFNPKSFQVSGPFKGVLQLHGVARLVSGTIKMKVEDEELEVECDYSLSIAEFKIQRPSYANISMTDDVKVRAKATAKLVRTP
ncbi:YceI family protein [bacterium]|nr:YceI family protein [bacterium]